MNAHIKTIIEKLENIKELTALKKWKSPMAGENTPMNR